MEVFRKKCMSQCLGFRKYFQGLLELLYNEYVEQAI